MDTYGKKDSNDRWFDGFVYRNYDKTDYHRLIERGAMDYLNARHPDGCFNCPRCRFSHYIPDNYDYLCDGCVNVLLVHHAVTEEMLANILEWKIKASTYYRIDGYKHPDITARIIEREALNDDLVLQRSKIDRLSSKEIKFNKINSKFFSFNDYIEAIAK